MRTYKRLQIAGGCYFFTVNLAERYGNDTLIRHFDNLRAAFKQTRNSHPFEIDAIVILPEHLHCIWQLPADDSDYPTRWRLIKSRFSMGIPPEEAVSQSRQRKRERGIWQSFRVLLTPLAYIHVGNAVIGNTASVMMTITKTTWITSITTP